MTCRAEEAKLKARRVITVQGGGDVRSATPKCVAKGALGQFLKGFPSFKLAQNIFLRDFKVCSFILARSHVRLQTLSVAPSALKVSKKCVQKVSTNEKFEIVQRAMHRRDPLRNKTQKNRENSDEN